MNAPPKFCSLTDKLLQNDADIEAEGRFAVNFLFVANVHEISPAIFEPQDQGAEIRRK